MDASYSIYGLSLISEGLIYKNINDKNNTNISLEHPEILETKILISFNH